MSCLYKMALSHQDWLFTVRTVNFACHFNNSDISGQNMHDANLRHTGGERGLYVGFSLIFYLFTILPLLILVIFTPCVQMFVHT